MSGKISGLGLMALLSAGPLSAAPSLVANGDFTDVAAFSSTCRTGEGKDGSIGLVTEDLTWNKCVRLVLGKANGTADLWVGGADGAVGFPVEPETLYDYSFALKDADASVRVVVKAWGEGLSEKGQAVATTTGVLLRNKIGNTWKPFKGSFTAPKGATRAVLSFILFRYKSDLKAGDSVLVDNVVVRNASGDFRAFAKSFGRPFSVAPVQATVDPSIPFRPEEVMSPPKRIDVRAAVNEQKALPIAVANLTDRLAVYRVVLEHDDSRYARLVGRRRGLKGLPAEAMTVREAVRMRASDTDYGEHFLDPLPKMNEAMTITVPPHEAGLVLFDFDLAGVPSGKYEGCLRVIPLFELAAKGGKEGYRGEMQEIPVSLEVLPIVLPAQAVRPAYFDGGAINEAMFRQMVDLGTRLFLITPFAFRFATDGAGNVLDRYEPRTDFPYADARQFFANHLAWAKKYGIKANFEISFRCYRTCCRMYKRKEGTPEADRTWLQWLAAVKKLVNGTGVADADFVLQLTDEPGPKDRAETLRLIKLSKTSYPTLRFCLSFFGSWTEAELREIEPYLDQYSLQDLVFLRNPGFHAYVDELIAKGKVIYHYTCETRTDADRDYEYRQNAWIGERYNVTGNGLYHMMDNYSSEAGAGDWIFRPLACMLYRSHEDVIPSLRAIALRQGIQDVKYLKALVDACGDTSEVKRFISDSVKRVTDNPAFGDRGVADKVVNETIGLILKGRRL